MAPRENDHRSPETRPQKHLITTVNGGTILSTTNNNNHHEEENDVSMAKVMVVDETPVRYTSLREVLPAEIRTRSSEEEIQIKNRLVKQAALAYLSPKSIPLPKFEPYWWLKKLFFMNSGGNSGRRLFRSQSSHCMRRFDDNMKGGGDQVGCIDFFNSMIFCNDQES